MKNFIVKAMSGFSLMTVVLLMACGNNSCPNGQQMYNGVCSLSQNVNGSNCQTGQLSSQQGECLQSNINGCTGNQGWSQQYHTCMPGTIVTNNGYNTGYNTGYNSGYGVPSNYPPTGYPNGSNNGCSQQGFVYTYAYGCLPQANCPYGLGLGPFGCTH